MYLCACVCVGAPVCRVCVCVTPLGMLPPWVCMHACVCIFVCICAYVHVYLRVRVCICISVCLYVYVCVANLSIRICLYDSNQITEDSNPCMQGADTLRIQRPNTRGDSDIRTSSCSTDLMVIQTRIRVISCECLCVYLYHFM